MAAFNVIIVLPGTTGTSLVQSQSDETSSTPFWMDLAIKEGAVTPTLAAAQLVAPLWAGTPGGYGKDTGYASLINTLCAASGYTQLYASWPTNDPATFNGDTTTAWLPNKNVLTASTVIGWGYDWRQDNLVTAKMLQNFLSCLWANNQGNIGTITLIGHSMGGLVSRAYLEYVGSKDPWFSNIDQLITLGTPHLGAPLAMAPISETMTVTVGGKGNANFFLKLWGDALGILKQDAVDNVIKMIELVINDGHDKGKDGTQGMGVSTYQLLPPPNVATNTADASLIDFITDVVAGKTYNVGNMPAAVLKLIPDLNQANLAGAENYFSKLNYTANPIPYNCIYGVVNAQNPSLDPSLQGVLTTTTGFSYDSGNNTFLSVDTVGGGDLVVPIASAMFASNTSSSVTTFEVLGCDHITMPGNQLVQNKVRAWLNFPA